MLGQNSSTKHPHCDLIKAGRAALASLAACMATGTAFAQDVPDISQFGTGVVFADDEQYQSMPKRKRTRGVVMFDQIDLSTYFPPPGNQSSQGSCAAWAVGYGARSYYMAADYKRPLASDEALSPSYIFNQITPAAFDENASCGGVTFQSALDVVKEVGSVSLEEMAYDHRTCRPTPSEEFKTRARNARIPDYTAFKRAELSSPRRFKEVLASGHPILVAMKIVVNDYMSYRGGVYTSTAPEDAQRLGHGLVLVGFDDAKKAFLLYNSWGGHWGEDGKMWISYETFQDQIAEAYVIEGLTPPQGVFQSSVSGLPSLPSFGVPQHLIVPISASTATTPKLPITPTPPDSAPEPEPEPAPAPVAPTKPPAALFEELADGVRCGRLVTSAKQDGSLVLTGFAGPQERNAIVAAAKAAAPDAWVEVTEMSWPACEAAALLPQNNASTNLVVVAEQLSQITGQPKPLVRLQQDERFRIAVAGSEGPSFLQIFYLQADQSAKEIYRGEAMVAENGVFGVSFGDVVGGLRATKPYGPEAIIVMASDGPVIDGEIGMNVADFDFLDMLSAASDELAQSGRPFVSVMQNVQVMDSDNAATSARLLITPNEADSLAELSGADTTDWSVLDEQRFNGPQTEPIGLIRHANDLAFVVGDVSPNDLSFFLRTDSGLIDLSPRMRVLGELKNSVFSMSDIKTPPGHYRFRMERKSDELGEAAIEFTVSQ